MNLVKLKKYAKQNSEERLFGVSSYSSDAVVIEKQAEEANGYDDDSISSMVSACSAAADHLYGAAQEIEVMENALIEWRDLALALWEDLDKDDQQRYVAYWSMTDEQKQRVHDAFKLEDLKKL